MQMPWREEMMGRTTVEKCKGTEKYEKSYWTFVL
jgi:hypothetical protein